MHCGFHRGLQAAACAAATSLVTPETFQRIWRVLNTNVDARPETALAITAIEGVGRRCAHACQESSRAPPRGQERTLRRRGDVRPLLRTPRQDAIPGWFLNRQEVKGGNYSQVLADGLDNLERRKKMPVSKKK
ncbi:40S ribosomal protein S18-like [Tupaia chinensis]|uniref:40S ribosomal protein S18-like n=1 Tax=Tupaia chinensis TaxID=246437 RepID=UPI0007044A69|nr:40S ribosomal protein S18-like [Tupaia chinensis]